MQVRGESESQDLMILVYNIIICGHGDKVVTL